MDRKGVILRLLLPPKKVENGGDVSVASRPSADLNSSADSTPLSYGWIEFPERASRHAELRELIQEAARSAKARERFGGVVQLQNQIPNGRFRDLESAFQRTATPFDFGGEDPIDRTSWEGWWRPGQRCPVIYEVASSGEQFVPLNDLRSLLAHEDEGTLKECLAILIGKHDRSPPTDLLVEALG